ncbi:MAG: DUF445 family protein [Victivallales bacterium]|nr:DUF445 family protein [Victivallales bacterium]
MNIFKPLLSECASRWEIVRNANGKSGRLQRAFALMEIFCFPVSFFVILSIPLQYVLVAVGAGKYIPPVWNRVISPVLLAGAVGYLTNWLAIMMLFRPFEPVKWLVIWPQGMVPRNKPQVARAVGEQVGNKLLSPEKIAGEFSERIIGYMRRPEVIKSIKEAFQKFLMEHQEDIINFLVPHIEQTLLDYVDKLVTPQRIKGFWNDEIVPWLCNEDNRRKIASGFVSFCKEHSSMLSGIMRERIRTYLNQRLSSIPIVGKFSDKIADVMVEFFADEKQLKTMISDWLAEPQTLSMLETQVSNMGERLSEWMNTAQANEKLGEISHTSRARLKNMIGEYLHTAFPDTVRNTLNSDKLWDWLEHTFLPQITSKLSNYIIEHRQTIVENLKLSERIEDAINKQDVRQFYKMVNEIAAQHFGAIQVLGFVLGVIVGILQLLQSYLIP